MALAKGGAEHLQLENMQAKVMDQGSSKFVARLLQLGNGYRKCDANGELPILDDFANVVMNYDDLLDIVYLLEMFKNHEWLAEHTILAPKNEAITRINQRIQSRVPGTLCTYTSINNIIDSDEAVHYPVEFLNSGNPSGFPEHKLQLKEASTTFKLY